MITIEALSKKYHGNYAIKNISLKVEDKEVVAIVGPSGSGKTTLLRCVNRLEVPSAGHVYISDTKITGKNIDKMRHKIGMVFQNFNLFPHMNVMENLIYAPMQVLKMKKDDAKLKAKNLLEKFGLGSKSNSKPNDLSGGQKQRIAIARSLMMNPEIILFDEPTSALDPEMVQDIVEVIKSLKTEMTVVVVTHHIRFAKAIADRIIFMDQGQVLCNQKNAEFFEKPKSHRARLFLEKVGEF